MCYNCVPHKFVYQSNSLSIYFYHGSTRRNRIKTMKKHASRWSRSAIPEEMERKRRCLAICYQEIPKVARLLVCYKTRYIHICLQGLGCEGSLGSFGYQVYLSVPLHPYSTLINHFPMIHKALYVHEEFSRGSRNWILICSKDDKVVSIYMRLHRYKIEHIIVGVRLDHIYIYLYNGRATPCNGHFVVARPREREREEGLGQSSLNSSMNCSSNIPRRPP